MVEWEQNLKGKKVNNSFKEITESIKDKNHIVYVAFEFRKNPNRGKFEERKFVSKLEQYLDELETTI